MEQALTHLSTRAREIVAVARDILENEGAAALTMRRLATRLGLTASSIYEHLRDKAALEAALIAVGLAEQAAIFAEAVTDTDDPITALATAQRTHARNHPNLYRLMTERPLPPLPPGLEDAAAYPLMRAVGGDVDRARALWAFGHGMVILELNERFPADADLDRAWAEGIAAFSR